MTLDEDGWHSLLPELTDAEPDSARAGRVTPDQRDGAVYVIDDELRLAVDVALAARRPLLLRGDPGSGKSSLAAFLARNLGWRYYEHVVTARTRPRDLLWTFDAVRKLADASARDSTGAGLRDHDYVDPGVLWWAFDPESACRRGLPQDQGDPTVPAREPDAELNAARDRTRAVVLIDEVDKADPDLPNGLLVPLGSSEFRVEETGTLVRRRLRTTTDPRGSLLIVITTNEERELPPAFLRRCVIRKLEAPRWGRMVEIGRRHLEVAGLPCGPQEEELLTSLAKKVESLQDPAPRPAARAPGAATPQRGPSTAEFLDAVYACRALGVPVDGEVWERLQRLVLLKDAGGDSSA